MIPLVKISDKEVVNVVNYLLNEVNKVNYKINIEDVESVRQHQSFILIRLILIIYGRF